MLTRMYRAGALAALALTTSISDPSAATSIATIQQIEFSGTGISEGHSVNISGKWIFKDPIPVIGFFDIFVSQREQRPIQGNAVFYSFNLRGSPLSNISKFDTGSYNTGSYIGARIQDGEILTIYTGSSGYDCGPMSFGWSKGNLGSVSHQYFSSCNPEKIDEYWRASIELAPFRITPGLPITPEIPATPVPEPATWALLIVGFGAVGAAARRHRKLVSA